MKQGLTYQLTERKGAADGHSAAVPLSVAFNHIDIMVFAAYNLPSIFFQLWVVRQLLSESFNISSQSLYGIVIDK